MQEISVKKHGRDRELIPTFSPYEIYQYSDNMLKHLRKDASKKLEKTFYYNDVNTDRRNDNGAGLNTKGLDATQIEFLLGISRTSEK